MSSIFFYEKDEELNIFDLIYFKDGKLDLVKIYNYLNSNQAKYGDNSIYNSEGYTDIKLNDNKNELSCTYIFENSLGYFTEISYDSDTEAVKENRRCHKYFAQSRLIITNEPKIIVKASYSNEESTKTKILNFFEDIGIKYTPIKFDNQMFQFIRNNFVWKKIKIQRIDKIGDSTKNLSYEIDPASEMESQVDTIYSECGVFEHIAFLIEYEDDLKTVKLYKNGHRIVLEDGQFRSKKSMEKFCIHLYDILMNIKSGKYENSRSLYEKGSEIDGCSNL
ncbi:hypothetical protein [Clostridium paridis]|uniref:Uncharacterized protein n=1 Tax=Clostridium paridis TaxID=2803863 RepID=A0A937FKK7_9CLOT|nr:hypothetical protein [Clostridium paridis]MBL4933931.1 hypothetical protein [Clostridium paridis]